MQIDGQIHSVRGAWHFRVKYYYPVCTRALLENRENPFQETRGIFKIDFSRKDATRKLQVTYGSDTCRDMAPCAAMLDRRSPSTL